MIKIFTDIHKYLTLILSDKLSSLLKISLDLKDISCECQEYLKFSESIPQFSYIILLKFQNRGILLFIDSKIIYRLSNRMLGGKGGIEKKPDPKFTFSEEFMAKKIVELFFEFYKESKLEVHFLRTETDPNLLHVFYPDESVYTVAMNCKINNISIGNILVCYPQIVMDKKESAWGV